MKRVYLFGFVILIVAVVGCCSKASAPATVSPLDAPPMAADSPLPTSAALTFTRARIMFLSNRDGEQRWYSMESDGSDVQHLSFLEAAKAKGIVWVPDLRAFSAVLDLDGQYDLYLLDAQGNVMRRLTSTLDIEGSFTYSSAAGQFAFTCLWSDLDICTVSISGGEISRLSNYPSREDSANWSPSGEQVLFVSNRDVVPDVWVVNRDGSDLKNLTPTGQPHGFPHWSPDGEKILFTSQRDFNWEVYVMDADGQNPVNLTNHSAEDIDPQWSPDGKYIAFRSKRTGDADIYVMNAGGSDLVNVTSLPESNENVFAWSPDSEKILYVSDVDGDTEVYIVNRDGTEPTNLTNNSSDDFAPQWIYYQ